ncbi:hypothetical protein SAMN05216436_101255 [bacterium A37T11]|nr:hypothetical protein SAMN05216436_101255 [bacterium A37T11]
MIQLKNPDIDKCDKRQQPVKKLTNFNCNCDIMRQLRSQMKAFKDVLASFTFISVTIKYRLTFITSHVTDVK